ncbi:hypothetical protein Ae505Ps2_5599c [Pseudonocardia sp. Ae505_Ps2]|nr:hypothetical protein Ae505Ps2_5599c [Pseudonocardia sp. Ae505_Ps2]
MAVILRVTVPRVPFTLRVASSTATAVRRVVRG